MKIVPSIRSLVSALCLGSLICVLFAVLMHAQTVESATQALLDKAHALEVRGRMDMAAQTWQQVLLVDPRNQDALAGLARSASQSGSPALAKIYLDRLRAINPDNPNIPNNRNTGHAESMGSHASQAAPLHQPGTYPQALHDQPRPSAARTTPPPRRIAEPTTARSRNLDEQKALSALNAKNLPEAEALFKAILTGDPRNVRALTGMGQVRMQQSNFSGAIAFFEQAKQDGARDSDLDAALESAQFNSAMSQGSNALAENNLATAEQHYRSALAIRPTSPEALQGLGETLLKAQQSEAAIAVYERYVQAKPTAPDAWGGLFSAQYGAGKTPQALQTEDRMPPTVRAELMRDPGFQLTMAAIYQSQNKLDLAQDILEKSVSQQTAAGQKPSTSVLLQLAGIYLAQNKPQQAFPIYRGVLSEDADRPDAWKGLLALLHATGRDGEALAQIQQIPPAIRTQLEKDVEYLQTVAAIYNSLGQTREAMAFFNRVQERYAAMRTAAPAAIDIQAASLLVNSDNNSDNDAGLYHQLLLLGDRRDLSDEQRRTIQMIWTNWAIRRASQCADAGETGSSLVLLNAAAHSFPDNPAVPRALADGYVRAGLPQQAVLIFKSQNMTAATASDYKSAVDAAAAAGDTKDAKIWLHSGLDKFPKDPEMLNLGAKYEQAHGNSKRAAEYSRAARAALAALAALPPQDPGAELAIELSKPQPIARPSTPKQPQDLAPLLGGLDAQEVAPQSKPAPLYLPSYSNIYGAAPVQVPLQPSSTSVVPSFTTNPSH